MAARRGLHVLWIVATLLGSGCASSPWATAPSAQARQDASATGSGSATFNPGAVAGDKQGSAAAPSATGPGAGQSARQVDPREVDQLVAQVAAAERIDPAVRDQLAHDLRQIDPALWPAFVQQFRASLAFRRAREERDRATAAGVVPQPARATPDAQTSVDRGSRNPESGIAGVGPLSRSSYEETLAPAGQAAEARPVEPTPPLRRLPGLERPSPDRGVVQAAAFSEITERRDPGTVRSMVADGARPGRATAGADDARGRENWQERLSAAIAGLESELRDAPQSAPGVDLQARLRMLYLLADRREDALRPIPAAPPAVQEFWSQELFGLATWLDTRRVSDRAPSEGWSRRAGESKAALAGAVHCLEELGPLVVRNLAFITEVKSYGVYKPFAKYEFTPGQELLLYAEVEDFKSEDTPKGFHTVLQGSYQIFDGRGQRVASQPLNTVDEFCRNPRRDFYIPYNLTLPKLIYAGKHTLQLTLVDQRSQKIGQASIEFGVKDGGE